MRQTREGSSRTAVQGSSTVQGPHYARFQGTRRHEAGFFPGVFALVNGLASDGRLTAEQEAFRRTNNAWYDAAYTNPSHVDPAIYDRSRNPGAVAWFKHTSHDLIERVAGYLAILTDHGIEWEELRSVDPGLIIYEDDHQVVVTPARAGAQ